MDRVTKALKATTYSEIARKTGTTPGFVSMLFRGRRNARVATLGKIAKALGVSLDELHSHIARMPKNGYPGEKGNQGWQAGPKARAAA